jgi:hypothetical protein
VTSTTESAYSNQAFAEVPTGVLLTLTATSSSFGNTVDGDTPVLPVVITNTGTSGVTISSASVCGTGFKLSNPSLPLTPNAGQSSSFSVTFAPETTGAFSVRLHS